MDNYRNRSTSRAKKSRRITKRKSDVIIVDGTIKTRSSKTFIKINQSLPVHTSVRSYQKTSLLSK